MEWDHELVVRTLLKGREHTSKDCSHHQQQQHQQFARDDKVPEFN